MPLNPTSSIGSPKQEFDLKEEEKDQFDPVPVYEDEKVQASPFRKVINFLHNTFSPLVNGVRSAFLAIQHAFGRSDDTSAALRHIKDDAPVSMPKRETSMSTHPSLVEQKVEAEKVEVEEIIATAAPVFNSDAGDFSHYMRDYKRDQANGVGTVCPQNFKEGAIRHAQKLFDSETTRCTKYADRLQEYSLPADAQLEIKAAAALLNKPVPYPVTLKSGEVREVAINSIDEFGSFLAWREWKEKGNLPENGIIDLDAAKKYAESYVQKYSKPEYLKIAEINSGVEAAFDLITYQSEYARKLTVQLANVLMQDIAELKKPDIAPSNSPSTLPPPPRPSPSVVAEAVSPPPPQVGAVSVSPPPPSSPQVEVVSVSPPPPPPPRVKPVVSVPTTAETAQDNAHAASALASLSSLSSEEVTRGKANFEKFVVAFTKASPKGGIENLLNEKEFLAPACVAMANAFFESVAYAPGVQLQKADELKFQAAAYLVNAGAKIQREKT